MSSIPSTLRNFLSSLEDVADVCEIDSTTCCRYEIIAKDKFNLAEIFKQRVNGLKLHSIVGGREYVVARSSEIIAFFSCSEKKDELSIPDPKDPSKEKKLGLVKFLKVLETLDLEIVLDRVLESKNPNFIEAFFHRLTNWVSNDEIGKYRDLWIKAFRSLPKAISFEVIQKLFQAASLKWYGEKAINEAQVWCFLHTETIKLKMGSFDLLWEFFSQSSPKDESLNEKILIKFTQIFKSFSSLESEHLRKEIANRLVKILSKKTFLKVGGKNQIDFEKFSLEMATVVSTDKLKSYLSWEDVVIIEKWVKNYFTKKIEISSLKIKQFQNELPISLLRGKNQNLSDIADQFIGFDVMIHLDEFLKLMHTLLKCFPKEKAMDEKEKFFQKILEYVLLRAKNSFIPISYMEVVVNLGNLFDENGVQSFQKLLDPYLVGITAQDIELLKGRSIFKANPPPYALKIIGPLWDEAIGKKDIETFLLLCRQISPSDCSATRLTMDFVLSKNGIIAPFLNEISEQVLLNKDKFQIIDQMLLFAIEFNSNIFEEDSWVFISFKKNVLKIIASLCSCYFPTQLSFLTEDAITTFPLTISSEEKRKWVKNAVLWMFTWLSTEENNHLLESESALRDEIALILFEDFTRDLWSHEQKLPTQVLLKNFVEKLSHLFLKNGPEFAFAITTIELLDIQSSIEGIDLSLPILHRGINALYDSKDLWERRRLMEDLIFPFLFQNVVSKRAKSFSIYSKKQIAGLRVTSLEAIDQGLSMLLKALFTRWPDFKLDDRFLSPDINYLMTYVYYVEILVKLQRNFSYEVLNRFVGSIIQNRSSFDDYKFSPLFHYHLPDSLFYIPPVLVNYLVHNLDLSKNSFSQLLDKAAHSIAKLKEELDKESSLGRVLSSILYASIEQLKTITKQVGKMNDQQLKNVKSNLSSLILEVLDLSGNEKDSFSVSRLQNGENYPFSILTKVRNDLKALEDHIKVRGTLWTDVVETKYQTIKPYDIYELEKNLDEIKSDRILSRMVFAIRQSYEGNAPEEHGKIVNGISEKLISRTKETLLEKTNQNSSSIFYMIDFLSFFNRHISLDSEIKSLIFDFIKKETDGALASQKERQADWLLKFYPNDESTLQEISQFKIDLFDLILSNIMTKYWRKDSVTPYSSPFTNLILASIIDTYPERYPPNGVGASLVNLLISLSSVLVNTSRKEIAEEAFRVVDVLKSISSITLAIQSEFLTDSRLLNPKAIGIIFRILSYYHYNVLPSKDDRALMEALYLFKIAIEKKLFSTLSEITLEDSGIEARVGVIRFIRTIGAHLLKEEKIESDLIVPFITDIPQDEIPIGQKIVKISEQCGKKLDFVASIFILQLYFSARKESQSSFLHIHAQMSLLEKFILDAMGSIEKVGLFEKISFCSLVSMLNPWDSVSDEGINIESEDFELNYFQSMAYLLSLLQKVDPSIQSELISLEGGADHIVQTLERAKKQAGPRISAKIDKMLKNLS